MQSRIRVHLRPSVRAAATVHRLGSDLMVNEQPSPVSVKETVARITKGAEADGWKVLGIRELHESIKKGTGKDVLPVHLVDLCQPHHAKRMLDGGDTCIVSVFMPCTISIYEKSDGRTYVCSTNANLLDGLFGGTIAEIMGGEVADAQTKFFESVGKAD